MTDMPGPNETRLNLIDGVEYITLRADDFRTVMREPDELRAEVEQIREAFDTRLREADPEGIWWMEVATLRVEVERLRAALSEITDLELEGDASLGDAIVIADEALNPSPVSHKE